MSKNRKRCLWSVGLAVLLITIVSSLWLFRQKPNLFGLSGDFLPIEIQHPIEGAVMPFNMPPPVVLWNAEVPRVTRWMIGFKAGSHVFIYQDVSPMWRPPLSEWNRLKQAARYQPIELVLAGYPHKSGEPIARVSLRFQIATNTLESPLFFREVNLPFADAVKDPSKIRWRFGSVGNPEPPPIILEKLPVCGNCHSFSRDGRYLAMDIDYANSKGSYVITRTAPEMQLATSDIITWDDYRREDGQETFGLLSQISPDGRYVLSTVKDSSIFVPRPELAFSQLFFPLKGIIAVYDREAKRFWALPGADDPAFVQSNPTWSPDGQTILFARHQAIEARAAKDKSSILMTPEQCDDFLTRGREFRYDLYRVPFNGGKGGKAEPLPGASRNGKSNYFPKYSPDGRWIIFCQSTNYMLLRPDSELFIMSAAGEEPKRLRCNLQRMNSWHSWSPDGQWLVFSSKAFSDYTQLCLTHISEQGEASPPVWLAHMVEQGRAANIPEFVSLAPDAIKRIREQFLDDYSWLRAGNQFFKAGEADQAIAQYLQALKINPKNAMAHQRLGFLLHHVKRQTDQAIQHLETAVQIDNNNAFAQFDLGMILARRNDFSNGIAHLSAAVRLLPDGYDSYYNAVAMHHALADAYYRSGQHAQTIPVVQVVLQRETNHTDANYLMAMCKVRLGETDTTTPFFDRAVRGEPLLGGLPDYYDFLSENLVKNRRYPEALAAAGKGHQLAMKLGRAEQMAKLQQRIQLCRSKGARQQ